eukprot:15344565-Ditylum_brightwellii.AAC.1
MKEDNDWWRGHRNLDLDYDYWNVVVNYYKVVPDVFVESVVGKVEVILGADKKPGGGGGGNPALFIMSCCEDVEVE